MDEDGDFRSNPLRAGVEGPEGTVYSVADKDAATLTHVKHLERVVAVAVAWSQPCTSSRRPCAALSKYSARSRRRLLFFSFSLFPLLCSWSLTARLLVLATRPCPRRPSSRCRECGRYGPYPLTCSASYPTSPRRCGRRGVGGRHSQSRVSRAASIRLVMWLWGLKVLPLPLWGTPPLAVSEAISGATSDGDGEVS
ncbi:hypothetical protein GGR56DRAFT_155063 [Xylariaceae sp. FL0804]|nr:hypothetical protein GGR56DRAFT_155063 [Xylariaceae sp. FL0804]